MAAPGTNSSIPKRFQADRTPSSLSALGAQPNSSSAGRTWWGRKRDSEWVFRPLRLKFKVKELEQLYKNAVYRQQQTLLIWACVLMVGLSLLVLLTFLGTQSVS